MENLRLSPTLSGEAPPPSEDRSFTQPKTYICFSHLRWGFVFQRPQHLMSRLARMGRVIFWEEPEVGEQGAPPGLSLRNCPASGVLIATPRTPEGLEGQALNRVLRGLLDDLMKTVQGDLVRWYYTPMMLGFSRHLAAACTVYDCMDELANFRFAPADLLERERELFGLADVVFTGGYSLFEAKRDHHRNIRAFPSSVDRSHFAQARAKGRRPVDQAALPGPRLGFYGVIDERMDFALLAAVADARPDWSLIMVGPVVKVSPADLPQRPNIHYLGAKSYEELPAYLAGWDVALMPFAINESTRFISPTKTPEYLAGGRPVVSTPIADVIRHYGDLEAVKIAGDPKRFMEACEEALALAQGPDRDWLQRADDALSPLSWDHTFGGMFDQISRVIAGDRRSGLAEALLEASVPVVRPATRRQAYDYLVVGAGFAGSVVAERLASQLGKRILLIDRRPHIGGNAYDEINEAGVLMHRYGPHIFHTNSEDILRYLSKFTRWRAYEHRVLARLPGGMDVPMPINRTTLNRLYGLSMTSQAEAEAFLAARAEAVEKITTSEDVVVSKVGRDLYERFFRGYTRKQWGLDPSELDKSVTARVPTRTDTDDRYFTDRFQCMPADGYTRMFENMLDHPNITIQTGVDYRDVRQEAIYDHLVFTGPLDEYFDHRFGPLPYRSLAFRHETLGQAWFQPVGTVNYPDEETPYTRISEYKHITGQAHARTTITYEYPQAAGDPYYPIPRPENQALYKRYEALALTRRDVSFVGRLATYRYYNMDQVVGQALATFRRLAAQQGREISQASHRRTPLEAGEA